jgi:NADH-quinone oxidoreductase subunit L
MTPWLHTLAPIPVFAPLVAAVLLGLRALWTGLAPTERATTGWIGAGLAVALLGHLSVGALTWGSGVTELDYGTWIQVGAYEIPAVLRIDHVGAAFAVLSASLTAMVAWFSRTYLHKEPGFFRFYLLLGLFGTGTGLVATAGALDVMFAGWEMISLASALFIGFFHERPEPVRSALRAFATYRLCDAGFLLAIVTTHELNGSTRLSALDAAAALPPVDAAIVAGLFLLSTMGKAAQLPFSGWLPRAMEGPTPSSALFYGGVSLHAGLFLLLRTSHALQAAPVVGAVAVVVGVATAVYATVVARTHTDAKGALAHATLAQVGLILAEIAAGFTDLALIHLVGHAMLRVWQYLRTPNTLHDAHRLGHEHAHPSLFRRVAPELSDRLHAAALHRFRLDERLDAALAPILALAAWLAAADRRLRARLSLDEDPS